MRPPNEPDAISALSEKYAGKFEAALEALCAGHEGKIPSRLLESMAYSLRAGGKRLRPSLCLAVAEDSGVGAETAMPMAMALEFIHTASLIHDDLPCMDDDDLRRGRPANHKIFGEYLAVLAGDSLMVWAFGYALSGLVSNGVSAELAAKASVCLSEASGPEGVCGGQALDMDECGRELGGGFAYRIAEKKTAALIRASVVTGAIIGGRSEDDVRRYADYGSHLGMAFQIVDDILDATGTPEQLGKTPRKDEAQNKMTFVSAYGLEGAYSRAEEESGRAALALAPMRGENGLLIALAGQLAHRSH
jgi:geranylgeranyl diphosphate synthase type II